MEFTWSGLISPAVSWFRKIGPAKRHGWDAELLIQKSEYLYDMRDFVKEEKIKELMLGSTQTKEYRKWLYKEREIESHMNYILKVHKENSDGVLFSCMKLPYGDLMNALNEVTYHLENLPLGHGSASHASHKTATALINAQIEGRTHGQVEKTEDVKEKRQAEPKGESNLEVHGQRRKTAQWKEMPRGNIKPFVYGHEKNVGVTGPETHVFTKVLDDSVAQAPFMETNTLFSPGVGSHKVKTVNPKREAERKGKSSVGTRTEIISCSPSSFRERVETLTESTSVSGVKDIYSISSDFQMPSETVPTVVRKSLLGTDQVPASNLEPVTEEVVICPTQRDTRTMHESEIQHTSCEVEMGSVVHAAGTLETVSDGNERMLPIRGKEFEIVPSQNEGSSAARGATFISGPSIIAAVEMPLVEKTEAEISSKTERVQWLHELGLVVNRSTERTVMKIFQCLSGVEAGKIGIFGIGGIGKTTVLKALISYPKTKHIFDTVILVSVSRYWSVRKIQNDVLRQLCTLPERPVCSKLSVLYLQRNYQLKFIPMSFFQFMTSLKILNLSKTRIKSLPSTLFELKNLQVLILRDCGRLSTLPSEVGCLENLEVLDLRGTEISKLPDEVGGLASLSLLEVYFYGSINYTEYVKLPRDLISSGIISRLHALETLSIVVFPGDKRWYKDVKTVVTEVCNLTELSSLCFHFPEVKLLELFLQRSIAWNAQRFTEFKFVVGHDVKNIVSRVPDSVAFDYNKHCKCLRFINGENLPNAVLQILACSTAFYLDNHLDISSLSDFGVRNMNGLKFCIISECPKIETVVDSNELTIAVFPSLENLSVHHLWNLTRICEGIVPNGSFAGLRILSVHSCPKLKFVFSSFLIQFMSNLEDLTVEDCPAIEEIISEGEIIDSGCIALPRLKKLTLHYLPGLVNIWKSAWPSLEYASFYDCPKLRTIGLDSNLKHSIIEIKAEKSWWDNLEWEDTELQLHLQSCFTTITEDDL